MPVLTPKSQWEHDPYDRPVYELDGPEPPTLADRWDAFLDNPRAQAIAALLGVSGILLLLTLAFLVGGFGGDSQQLTTDGSDQLELADRDPADLSSSGGLAGGIGSNEPESTVTTGLITTTSSSVSTTSSTATPTTEARATLPTVAPTTAAAVEETTTTTVADEAESTTSTADTSDTTAGDEPTSTTASTSTTEQQTSSTTTTSTTTTTTSTTTTTTQASTGGGSSGNDAAKQQEILNLVNNERAAAGCGSLSLQPQLNAAADAHSEDMAANNYFSHTGLNGSAPWDRTAAAGYGGGFVGENIAQGYGTAASVMNGWMNSDGHRANILNCTYTHLGVGYANGTRPHYWTQVFGAGG